MSKNIPGNNPALVKKASAASNSLIVKLGKKLRNVFNSVATSQSRISTDPVLDPALFEWTEELAANWQVIAEEAKKILRHRDAIPPLKEISPDHAGIAGDGKWKSFFLVGYKYEAAENCARAPHTTELIRKIPGLNSAFFSILEPGAKIPRHRGVTRGIVTCHLGLDIPDRAEKCVMQVEKTKLTWANGKWLAFDDSCFHEVNNDTSQQRVILLVQVERPMRLFGRLFNALVLGMIRKTAFVQDARKNLDGWEEAYRKAEQNEFA